MVAYTALVSLLQILDSILHPAARGWRIFHNRAQLKSLHEKVSFLLHFIESSSSPYGKSKDSNLEKLEIKMTEAAYKAKYVIESDISNQILAERESVSFRTLPHILFVYLLALTLVAKLYYVDIQNVLVLWVQAMIPVEGVIPVSVQSLLPFSFQNVILVWVKVILPWLIIILTAIAAWAGFVMHVAVLKGISVAARYWLPASQQENQDLCLVIGDISSIMVEVTGIRDACGSGQSADGLSKLDFRGIGKSVVVGLDRGLNEINARLLGDSPELEIVSIVGMGGIGKTTLARQVHDDPNIVHHFDIRAWVLVSQEYSLRRVMLGLLDSAKIPTEKILQNNKDCNDDELNDKLGEHLHKNLMSRRYLIVMDDVWDTNILDLTRKFFPDTKNGSRVLLTTRLSEVDSYTTSGSPPLQMKILDDDYSWQLLCEKVFGGEDCPPELEAIGRTIAKKCRGLPLAIVVVGGLLYNEQRTVQDWTRISTSLNSILSEDDEQCFEILGLSYKHLPPRLKPCFLYVGALPGNEEICATRLFNLWAAEGFLEASKSKSLEEVAEGYLEDLVQRSLITVGKWRWNGKIRTCKIHDLMRQVCWRNIRKKNSLHFAKCDGEAVGHGEAENLLRQCTQFLNLNHDSNGSISFYLIAHSFMCAAGNVYDLSHIYLGFRLLRVLDIVPATSYEFPDEIFELVHLRYLGLTLTYGWRLSPSISRLWNLETLIFHNGRYSRGLRIPVEIWSMPNLRHLYFTKGLLPNPSGWRLVWNSCVLENLKTLVGILDFRCSKGILKSIPNLNKLVVWYDVPSSVDWSEYELESVVNLPQLETLKISVRYSGVYDERWKLIPVRPPKLAFPPKLKKLHLSGCRIPWESMRIVGALPNLEVLKLRRNACQGRIWEPVEGGFCQLKILLIENSDLEHWESSDAHFPLLQRLALRWCTEMKRIPSAIGDISTLERMELVGCHPSALASARQIQEEQKDMGNEDLEFIFSPQNGML